MVNKVDHTSHPKMLWSSLVIFLSIAKFTPLKSFKWYRWYCYWDFSFLSCLFLLLFFFSHLSLFNHVSKHFTTWVVDNNYNLRIRYVISNSLNYIISWIFITLCYSMNFLFLRQNPKENRFRCLQLIIYAYVKSYDISWLMMRCYASYCWLSHNKQSYIVTHRQFIENTILWE